MGRTRRELTITARLSRRNDERDDQERELWERFIREVRDIAERAEYDAIELYVDADC